ncbi:MAG: DUF2272 domain-containing protein [Armatimonadota bacterium]|nr:DUF2272 domain-containing protein [Armatimonadota bacterium]
MPEPPAPSEFAKKLAEIAKAERAMFGGGDEGDEPLKSRIKTYWETLGLDFPGVEEPWSAVFVSFCVKKAGATAAEFKFHPLHAVFVHEAINNPGAFKGVRISERAVNVGDIIHNNRGMPPTNFDFNHAKNHDDYPSHSAIVVARGVDENGKFALTIGGNELDSIRRKRVQLKADGSIKQKSPNPYISLLKNRK